MEEQNNQKTINIYSVCDKDAVRTQEQYHEALLKKRLAEFGIVADFNKISPFGFSKI
jgi:hypothetical protein